MKKYIIFPAITMLLFLLLGCSPKKNESKLAQYVTNYDEVYAAICNELSETNVIVTQCDDNPSDINTLEAFGNGNYWVTAKDIDFEVRCEDHIATRITYNNGSKIKTVFTQTFTKRIEESTIDYNNLKDVEVDPSMIHIEQ